MKIIFFSNSCWSIYNFRRNLIIKLLKERYKIIILSPDDNYSKKLKKLGCEVIKLNFENNTINFMKEIKLIIKLFFFLKKNKPDIMLNFTIKPLIFGSFVSGFLNIYTINMITGLGTNFVNFSILSKIILFFYKISFKKTSHIFFQNEDDLKLFLKKNIATKCNSSIIPGSGIDLKYFAYRKYKFFKKIKFILVSRILVEKGIHEYIQSATKLISEGYNCEFKILGPTIPNNKSSFNKKTLKKLLPKKFFRYLGFVNDVRPYIAKSNCVVLPSYREGTPRSLLEGLSMGRPIITTNAVGCKNLIKDGHNGFKCKVKNSQSLYLAMKKFIFLSKDKKIKMSKNSRKFVEKKYKDSIIINEYLNKIYAKNK